MRRLFTISWFFFLSGVLLAQQVDEISVDLTVEDEAGRVITGLDLTNFSLTFGKNLQKISSLSVSDRPLSIGILFDLSGSRNEGTEKKTKLEKNAIRRIYVDAVKEFILKSNSQNEYFLVSFNDEVDLITDSTQSNEDIFRGLDSLLVQKAVGNTRLYDAVDTSVNKLASAKHKKRALVVISDGADNASKVSFETTKKSLERSQILLYVILEKRSDEEIFYASQGFIISDVLALGSGGRSVYIERDVSARAALSSVAAELRSQYSVCFVPNIQPAGKPKDLKFALANGTVKKMKMRYRKRLIY